MVNKCSPGRLPGNLVVGKVWPLDEDHRFPVPGSFTVAREFMRNRLRRIGRALLLLLLIGGPVLACPGLESDEFCGPRAPSCATACCSQGFCHGSGQSDCNHTGCSKGMCRPDFRPGDAVSAPLIQRQPECTLLALCPAPRCPQKILRPLDGCPMREVSRQGHFQPPVRPPRD